MCFMVFKLGSIQYHCSLKLLPTCDNNNLVTTPTHCTKVRKNKTIILTCTTHKGETRDLNHWILLFHTCNQVFLRYTTLKLHPIEATSGLVVQNSHVEATTTTTPWVSYPPPPGVARVISTIMTIACNPARAILDGVGEFGQSILYSFFYMEWINITWNTYSERNNKYYTT
jgi:hypothetical protein